MTTAGKGMPALQIAGWALLAIGVVLLIQWAFANLRPGIKVVPAGGLPFPAVLTPNAEEAAEEVAVQPIVEGTKIGEILWSPDGRYAVILALAPAAPGGDRRTASIQFFDSAGEALCQASGSTFDPQELPDAAWLENNLLAYVDGKGRVNILSPCEVMYRQTVPPGPDPIRRIALGFPPQDGKPGRFLLLEGQSSYWVLDSQTLDFRRVESPLPSPDSADSFAYHPDGQSVAVFQPVSSDPPASRLVLVDLASGVIEQVIDVETDNREGPQVLEWLGPDVLFVWAFDGLGPILIDFSQEPLQPVRVLPELLDFDIVYPDEVSSMGAFYSQEGNAIHLVLHMNRPDDKSVYIYHSENGQIEHITSNRAMMVILPGDQRMPIFLQADEPEYEEGYELLWVDHPERSQIYIPVPGHMPRSYYWLTSRLLPGSRELVAASSRGISLVSLETGETLGFWKLTDAEQSSITGLSPSPDGKALIVSIGVSSRPEGTEDAIFWIPLPE